MSTQQPSSRRGGLEGNLLLSRLVDANVHLCAASTYRLLGGDLRAADRLTPGRGGLKVARGNMEVSWNRGTNQIIRFGLGFSILKHLFWGSHIYGNTHMNHSGRRKKPRDGGEWYGVHECIEHSYGGEWRFRKINYGFVQAMISGGHGISIYVKGDPAAGVTSFVSYGHLWSPFKWKTWPKKEWNMEHEVVTVWGAVSGTSLLVWGMKRWRSNWGDRDEIPTSSRKLDWMGAPNGDGDPGHGKTMGCSKHRNRPCVFLYHCRFMGLDPPILKHQHRSVSLCLP